MMFKDYINDTKEEINKTIRDYRGLDVPEETAKMRLMEINSVIFDEEPDRKFRLKDFLRILYSDYERPDPFGLDTERPYIYLVNVYPESDRYKPEDPYPLTFEQPLLAKKDYKLKIKNLRRFLADYQKQTNSWIGTNDIMDAEITDIKMVAPGRNTGFLEVQIRLGVNGDVSD